MHDLHTSMFAMRRMPKPVVAKTRPAAAAACDLGIAEEEAFFALAYCNIGTTPDGSSSIHLPCAIGPTHVYGMGKRLMYRSLENEFEAQRQMEAECFADCAKPVDYREGFGAFLEKRKAVFTGE